MVAKKILKALKAPGRKQAQRTRIIGKDAVHRQNVRSTKPGGYKAKETARRVGEYRSAKLKTGKIQRASRKK